MMQLINLTFHRDYLSLFGFLKDNPSRLSRKGDYYRLTYFLPLWEVVTPFRFSKIWLTVGAVSSDGWEVVRDFPIAYAGAEMVETLQQLELEELTKNRQGVGLELKGWILDLISYGMRTEEETGLFIRAMFVTGYSFEQVVALGSMIIRRMSLAPYFIQELNRIYKGVE